MYEVCAHGVSRYDVFVVCQLSSALCTWCDIRTLTRFSPRQRIVGGAAAELSG